MQNKIIVTFDFDGTLSRKDVQADAINWIKNDFSPHLGSQKNFFIRDIPFYCG